MEFHALNYKNTYQDFQDKFHNKDIRFIFNMFIKHLFINHLSN